MTRRLWPDRQAARVVMRHEAHEVAAQEPHMTSHPNMGQATLAHGSIDPTRTDSQQGRRIGCGKQRLRTRFAGTVVGVHDGKRLALFCLTFTSANSLTTGAGGADPGTLGIRSQGLRVPNHVPNSANLTPAGDI